MSGWHCSAQTALPGGWPSIHASLSGALVGSMAPQDWPGLCQKQAKFKDIPPPLRAFDAQNRNSWLCLRVAALSAGLQLLCSTPTTHPIMRANSYFLAFRGTTRGLTSLQGAAGWHAFSLFLVRFTRVSNKTSSYFKLLIAHLQSPSIIPQCREEGVRVGVERFRNQGLGRLATPVHQPAQADSNGWWCPGPERPSPLKEV